MREIKFRAWDRKDKLWVAGFSIGQSGTLSELGDKVFMQYTGLKDKTGKEIYEGDVVRAVHRSDEVGGWYSDSKVMGVVYFDAHWGVKFDCRDHTQRTAKHWEREAYPMEAEKMKHWSD
jgi:uncharacterized phage protein (TIGR01671 family)